MSIIESVYKEIELKDGQPCSHQGCERHISHPCEVCGRIGARGDKIVYVKRTNLFSRENHEPKRGCDNAVKG